MKAWLASLGRAIVQKWRSEAPAPFAFGPHMRELSSYARLLVAALVLTCVHGGFCAEASPQAVWGIVVVALVSALVAYWLPWVGPGRQDRGTAVSSRALSFIAVAGDIGLVTVLIHVTGGVQSPFYVIYFLVIVFASVFYTLGQAFIITGILSFWYLVVLLLGSESLVGLKAALVRIPFFYLATWFSGVVGAELERRRQQEASTAQQFRTLAEIAGAALSTLQVRSLLAPVLEKTLSLVSSRAGAILLADRDGTLRVLASRGLMRAAPGDVCPDRGIAVQAYTQCRTVVFRRAEPDAFWAVADPTSVSSVLAVPLQLGDRVFGVLYVADSRLEGCRPDHDPLLHVAANQVAMAIQNALEHEAALVANRRSALLLRLARSISLTHELRPLLKSLVTETADGLAAASAMLTLRDEGEDGLAVQAVSGDPGEGVEWPRRVSARDGLHGRAVVTGKPVVVVDLASGDLFDPALKALGVRQALAAPIRVDDRVIGAISVHDRKDGAEFGGDDAELLAAIADRAAVAIQNVQLHEQMERNSARITALFEAVETMSATNSIDEILGFVTHRVKELFPCDVCAVRLVNEETGALVLTSVVGLPEGSDERALMAGLPSTVSTCWAVRKDKPFVVDDVARDFACKHLEVGLRFRSYLCVPLTAGGKTLGVLQMMSRRVEAFSADHVQLLAGLGDQAAIAVQRAKLYEEVERLAVRDGLTGLFNYSYFHEQLRLELTRSKRNHTPVALILMDIDRFKSFNDTYGHPAGDVLLKRLAEVLRETVRAVDLTARMGGEEFAVLLPDTDKAGARLVAEKLRAAVESAQFVGNAATPVVHRTISLGVASYPQDAKARDELVRRADEALYEAKAGGRNAVALA